MTPDFRVKLDYFTHPKTVMLTVVNGPHAALWPLMLWSWAAKHYPTGKLGKIPSSVITVGACLNNPDHLAAAEALGLPKNDPAEELIRCGFVDNDDGSLSIHEWDEHNPWVVTSDERSELARRAGIASGEARRKKRLNGTRTEAEQSPNTTYTNADYATSLNGTRTERERNANGTRTPSPSPSPRDLDTPPLTPPTVDDATRPPAIEGVVDAFLSGEPEQAKSRTGLLKVATAAWTACQNVAPIRKAFEQLENWCASDNPPRAIVEAARTILDRTVEQFKKVSAEQDRALQKAAELHADMEAAKARSQTPEALAAREVAMASIKQTLGTGS